MSKGKNYSKAMEYSKDISKLTNIPESAVMTVMRGVSLLLAHEVAEITRDQQELPESINLEVPLIGHLTLRKVHKQGRSYTLSVEFKLTDAFYNQVYQAYFRGASPLDETICKKFTDMILDKYKSLI